jgi:hypothetical protein
MTDSWERLSFFESWDILTRAYHKRHGRRLSAEKARDIVSHLVQGREFFTSAHSAADLVRPLLLYYGVLALSRALILFLDTAKSRESALSPAHGCEVVDWQHDLAPGIQGLPTLKIRFREGTFSELTTATRNEESVTLLDAGIWPVMHRQPGALQFPPGTIVTVKEVLARIPKLQPLYERTFGERSACYPARIVFQPGGTQADITLYPTKLGLPREEEMRDAFGLPLDLPVSIRTSDYGGDNAEPEIFFRLERKSFVESSQQLPPMKNDISKNGLLPGVYLTSLVSPLPGGLNLSSLSFHYLIAYVTGMLVRYYPSAWRSLINRDRGDFAFPILRAAITAVEEQFPDLLLMDLEAMSAGDNVEWLV